MSVTRALKNPYLFNTTHFLTSILPAFETCKGNEIASYL